MKVGDRVRVTYNEPPYPDRWYGDEGIIVSQIDNGNLELRITKKVGTDLEPSAATSQIWSSKNLMLIEPIDEPTLKWLKFFGEVE